MAGRKKKGGASHAAADTGSAMFGAEPVKMVVGLPDDVFNTLFSRAASAVQASDDANMARAGAWKAIKDRGGNVDAVKLGFRISRWDTPKAQSFIRDLLEVCAHLGVMDQMELPLAAAANENRAAAPEDAGHHQADAEAPEETVTTGDPADDGEKQDIATLDAPGGDFIEPEQIDAKVVPENAGELFGGGETAALAGLKAEDNPHAAGTFSHRMWLKGFHSVPEHAKATPAADTADVATRELVTSGEAQAAPRDALIDDMPAFLRRHDNPKGGGSGNVDTSALFGVAG